MGRALDFAASEDAIDFAAGAAEGEGEFDFSSAPNAPSGREIMPARQTTKYVFFFIRFNGVESLLDPRELTGRALLFFSRSKTLACLMQPRINERLAECRHGKMVEVRGFEPLTFSLRTRRSTN